MLENLFEKITWLGHDTFRIDASKTIYFDPYQIKTQKQADLILISHDHCIKHRLCRYGGPGYAHILQNVVPMLMRERDMPEEHITALLVENPRRIMCLV